MVDYSKWDHLDASSSDSEQSCNTRLCVTRLDKPQSVTIGPSGVLSTTKKTAVVAEAPTSSTHEETKGMALQVSAKSSSISDTKHSWLTTDQTEVASSLTNELPCSKAVLDKDILDLSVLSLNGGCGSCYLWSQTATEVTATFFNLPFETRGRDVSVTISERDNHADSKKSTVALESAVCFSGSVLTVEVKKSLFLQESFPHPVDLDDNNIFWELKTFQQCTWSKTDRRTVALPPIENGAGEPDALRSLLTNLPVRALIVTVKKVTRIPNAVLWWNCLFLGGPEIDSQSIAERQSEKKKLQRKTFKEAWDAAHTAFLDRVKNRTTPTFGV